MTARRCGQEKAGEKKIDETNRSCNELFECLERRTARGEKCRKINAKKVTLSGRSTIISIAKTVGDFGINVSLRQRKTVTFRAYSANASSRDARRAPV